MQLQHPAVGKKTQASPSESACKTSLPRRMDLPINRGSDSKIEEKFSQ